MKKLLILATLLLCACTAPDTARHALSVAGYTNIQITGWKWLACSQEDTFHTGFFAQGPTGVNVTGVVCSGIFKGATIRID